MDCSPIALGPQKVISVFLNAHQINLLILFINQLVHFTGGISTTSKELSFHCKISINQTKGGSDQPMTMQEI